MAEEKYISSLKVSGVDYEISAASAASLSPDFDLAWSNVSGLAATGSDSSATSGFMTPEQIHEAILADAGKLASFKVVSAVPAAADADDTVIYLVGPKTTVTGDDKYEEWVKSGDEMVKIGDTSVDLSDYYTKEETDNEISSYVKEWGEAATSSDLPDLWKEVTGYVETEISAVTDTSAKLWNETYEAVSANSGIWTDAYNEVTGAVSTSGDMTDANSGKLAQVGAITGYVDAKIAETIAETIEIASAIGESTPTTAIPNVGALTGYVDEQVKSLSGDYLEKADVYVTAHELVINNL